jgi:hypothetical protein
MKFHQFIKICVFAPHELAHREANCEHQAVNQAEDLRQFVCVCDVAKAAATTISGPIQK